MGKRETKRANQLMEQQLAADRERFNTIYSDQTRQRDERKSVDDQLLDMALGQLGDARGEFDRAGGVYDEFSETGGWTPEDLAATDENIAAFKRYASSPELDRNRARGGGVFDEFAKTGGWDPERIANYRARIASFTPSLYAGIKSKQEQLNRVQSGINPGFTSQMRNLSRESARAGTEAIREGELGLSSAIDEGRRWGSSNMSASELALNELLSKNFFTGMGAANDTLMNRRNSISQGRLAGAGGLQSVGAGKAGLAEGIRSLYATPGASTQYDANLMNAANMGSNAARGTISNYTAYNPATGFWDNFGKILNAGAGAAGAFFGGGVNPATGLPVKNIMKVQGGAGYPKVDPSDAWY